MTRRRRTPQDLMTTLLNSRETPVPLPGRERETTRSGKTVAAELAEPENNDELIGLLENRESRVDAKPISVDELLLGAASSKPSPTESEQPPAEQQDPLAAFSQDGWLPSVPGNGQNGHQEPMSPDSAAEQVQDKDSWLSGFNSTPEPTTTEAAGSLTRNDAQPDSATFASAWMPVNDNHQTNKSWNEGTIPASPVELGDMNWHPNDPGTFASDIQIGGDGSRVQSPSVTLGDIKPAVPTAASEPEYEEGLAHLQRGDWAAAQACFTALIARYPDDEALKSLVKETELRTTAEKERPKINPWRKLSVVRRLGRRIIAAIALVLMVILTRQIYIQRIVPQQEQRVAEAKQVSLLDEARAALARGDFETAERTFNAVLLATPDDTQAAAGLAEAQRQSALLADYQSAVSLEAEGKTDEAMALYQSIRERAPVYRDVPQRISLLERVKQIDEAFAQAEAHFQAERWSEAVSAYENVRKLDGRYQTDIVVDRLFNSYLSLGKSLIATRPDSPQRVRDAVTAFNNALTLQPREESATTERQFARSYLDALTPYENKQWEEAISLLRPLYDQRPDYLGGLMVEQLYHAYLALGDSYRAKDELQKAWETYKQGSGLGLEDTSEASRKTHELALVMTPTATPTPTLTPTVTPTNQPSPSPTPEPTKQLALARYRGRIAFWSDRDGGNGLWIMNPDGTNAFRYNNSDDIEQLRKKETYNPQGTWQAFVKATGNGKDTQIFYLRLDVPESWQREFRVTDTGGIHYDPVWSPLGDRIAYVSNEADGDEIWIINPDGTDARRLTKNTWEWDKRPSWSPDGKQIVFWSNREGGLQQIFRMNADGTQQVNISRNKFNDSDPMWIK